MTIHAEFFEHKNLGGAVFTSDLPEAYRYYRIPYTGDWWNDRVSSYRATTAGWSASVFIFEHSRYDGRFLNLALQPYSTWWYSWVGGAFNDIMSSALLVTRSPNELEIRVRDIVGSVFTSEFDKAAEGTGLSRTAEPVFYTTLWPDYASDRTFITIEQDLNVDPDGWPWDYDAQVKFDIEVYLNAGKVSAYVAWVHTWVEGGLISGKVLNGLHPKMMEAAGTLTAKLQSLLGIFAGSTFQHVYLLPGRAPNVVGNVNQGTRRDDATIVLVR